MVPIEETYSFFSCYRMRINSYRLSPDKEAAQLSEILRRVGDARTADAPPVGPRTAPIQAGGSNT